MLDVDVHHVVERRYVVGMIVLEVLAVREQIHAHERDDRRSVFDELSHGDFEVGDALGLLVVARVARPSRPEPSCCTNVGRFGRRAGTRCSRKSPSNRRAGRRPMRR